MASELTMSKPRRPALRRLVDLRLILVLATIVGLIGLSGCRSAPVRDYNSQPIPPGLSMAQIGKAIQTAGNGLGWATKEQHEGLIIGTLYLRDHMAQVSIPFTRSSYSIRYKDSSNLDYDAEKKTIHSNYEGWVQNLNNAIRTHLESI